MESKKFFKWMMAMALIVTFAFCSSSCSDDDDEIETCYYTLGVENLSFSVFDSDDGLVMDYLSKVCDAYYKALGMSEDDNTIICQGDYIKKSIEMKNKFRDAALPEPLKYMGSYSFTIVLRGVALGTSSNVTGSLESYDIIASKKFEN